MTTTHFETGTIIQADWLNDIDEAVYTTLPLKAPLASPTFTGTPVLPTPFTLGATSVTATGVELNHVAGVTSAIQTQINAKAPLASPTFTGTVAFPTPFTLGGVSVTATGTELNYVDGVTSSIQTQINLLAPKANPTFTGTVAAATATFSTSFGYTTGAGGAITQGTNKATPVTIDKLCGQITTHGATLNASTAISFTVNNSLVAATDTVILNIQSGATANAYLFSVQAVSAGSFVIYLRNNSVSGLAETIVFNFAVIKAVAS